MKNKISENLVSLRRSVGKTQKEVAKEVGISAVTLSAYENGQKEPLLSYAAKLAKYYGVTLDSLCGIDRTERKEVTASDVLQTISTLNEMVEVCDIDIETIDDKSVVNMHIKQSGMWLHDFIRDQNKLVELTNTAGLDPSVLTSWKKSKFAEFMTTPIRNRNEKL